jgi:hypothetical protein
MPRPRKTPEEVSAARSAVARSRWVGLDAAQRREAVIPAVRARWGEDSIMPVAASANAEPVTAIAEPGEVITPGRWYSRAAMAHQDVARAQGREWACVCGACRVARMEAN